MVKFIKKKEVWGSIIAIGILAFCFKDLRWSEIKELADRANYYYFGLALIAEFLLIISKGVRWRVIVEPHKILPLTRTTFLYAAGQVLNISMPALTGQVGRVMLFAKKANLTKSYVFSTVLVEVLFDAMSLLFIIFLLSMASITKFPEEYRSASYIITIATVSIFALLYLVLTFKDKIGSWGKKTIRPRWPGFYITIKKFALSFTQGISLLKSTKYFMRTLFLSLAGWFFHIIAVYYLFYSFGFELQSFLITAMIIMVINTLALMIPITPGNAGTFEIAVVAPLVAFGIAKSDAVLFALALHIADFVPIFVMGFMFLKREKTSLKEIQEESEHEEIMENVMDPEITPQKDTL